MAAIRFSAPVIHLGERAIVRVPAEISAGLPSRGQVSVVGTIDEQPFETVVEPDGRRGHWINVSGAPGSEVVIEFEPTKQWPEPNVPEDFHDALAAAPVSAATWAAITPMARWEWVRWVNATRNPDTRAKRIEAGMDKLRKGMRRPCCFDLSSCTDPELSKSGKLIEP